MNKKPNAIRTVTDPVLPMDEIKKMSQKEACARFAERATVSQRAFAEMGKLHHAISASLKKGQTIYGELRKVGVKDSTISNASYASRVVDLVKAGHITEAQYDGFTFADCLAVCRVMGPKSKRQLAAEEVAAVLKAAPKNFDAEFTSLYETGLNIEEETARAEQQRKREAVGAIQDKIDETLNELDDVLSDLDEAEAQTIGDVPPVDKDSLDEAVWNAHHEAVKALLAKAVQVRADAIAQRKLEAQQRPPQAAPNPPPPASETAAPASDASDDETAFAPVSAPPERTPAPTAEASEPGAAADETAPTPAPTNVTAMPPDPDANLDAVLGDLDAILAEVAEMTVEAKKSVFAKLNELMAHLDSQINEAAAQVA